MLNRTVLLSLLIILFLAVAFCLWFPVSIHPPQETRMVLDHTYDIYIAPPCFEQAEITNNLTEATLGKAQDLNFKPESICTERALESQKNTIIRLVQEKLGLRKGYWDW